MSELDDKELLRQFRDSDTKSNAYHKIVRKYQERLYWHIRRMVHEHEDANDVLQNVLIKIWNNLDGFREGSKLYTWMYRIATNESLTWIAKEKKRKHSSLSDDDSELNNQLKSDDYFDGDETIRILKCAIETLPEKQKIVFNLRYYDEMPYEEMSGVLDTSVGALKASYHHAVKKIEEYINTH